ncbi:unnamed protein product [Chrysodeixis includens]|uniref:Caspase-4 n=1 Tax=Chrysodeixis includens TaxID=689277 RepID=A0A9P0BUI0_CHRIL|nr:unnamed protein product [Chrysodeixis includens]
MENELQLNYSAYEYVARKNRNKKKRKQKTLQLAAFLNSEDGPSESENSTTTENVNFVGNSIASDENGSDNDDESNRDDNSIYSNDDRTLSRSFSRVSLDAMLSRPAQVVEAQGKEIEEPEDVKVIDESNHFEENPKEEFTVFNTRALTKDATTYELEKFQKNALIIFNQETIDGHLPRLGTEKDLESLQKTFGNLGFEVDPHTDLTKDEIFKKLQEFTERDFTDYGCVAVAVMTHGSNNGLLRAKDQQYSEIEIINMFKDYSKPTLVTKPKVIIIQACRGSKIMPGVPVFRSGKIQKDLDKDVEPYILPVESDLLILHSSYVGSPSHRNELHGTWFIQALCSKINSLSTTHDLESIITEVKREVAIDKQHEEYNRRTFEMDINKQMPVMTSTLIRKLYLRNFGDLPKVETFVDKVKAPNDSRREVLDTVQPSTPLLVQFGPCSCFLGHFTYLRNCLRYFIEENPHDEAAQYLLDIANTFEDTVDFNTSKEKMTKAISKHLDTNAQSSRYYKFLHLYK